MDEEFLLEVMRIKAEHLLEQTVDAVMEAEKPPSLNDHVCLYLYSQLAARGITHCLLN